MDNEEGKANEMTRHGCGGHVKNEVVLEGIMSHGHLSTVKVIKL